MGTVLGWRGGDREGAVFVKSHVPGTVLAGPCVLPLNPSAPAALTLPHPHFQDVCVEGHPICIPHMRTLRAGGYRAGVKAQVSQPKG